MTEPRRKLTPQEIGKLGGLTSSHNMSADQRQARARKAGLAAREKLGPAHYLRMAHVRHGRLTKKGAASTAPSSSQP